MSDKSVKKKDKVKAILEQKFDKVHVGSALKHFVASKKGYRESDWEDSISKAGKFVEAVTKALLRFCGKTLPATRNFRAGNLLHSLGQEPTSIDDAIRIVIPKCCLFIYEVANNRGARHDPDEIDPNEIDAGVVDVAISWVLGELIRFSSRRDKNPQEAQELVEALTGRTYPLFEEIDDRFYINIERLSAEKTALLILYGRYPRRTEEEFLFELVKNHGFSVENSRLALRRTKYLCDFNDQGWKLRGLGRQKADKILSS